MTQCANGQAVTILKDALLFAVQSTSMQYFCCQLSIQIKEHTVYSKVQEINYCRYRGCSIPTLIIKKGAIRANILVTRIYC